MFSWLVWGTSWKTWLSSYGELNGGMVYWNETSSEIKFNHQQCQTDGTSSISTWLTYLHKEILGSH